MAQRRQRERDDVIDIRRREDFASDLLRYMEEATPAFAGAWAADLPPDVAAADRALLSDPQTSGGLLVSCAPECADDVVALFRRQGFAQAAVIGEVTTDSGRLTLA